MSIKQLKRRRRGCILSDDGWEKLQTRISQLESKTEQRHTPCQLSLETQLIDPQGLHPTTIKKILARQVGVDERSLRLVFQAVNLDLKLNDYAECWREEETKITPTIDAWSKIAEINLAVPEFPGRPLPLNSPFYIEYPKIQKQIFTQLQQPGSLLLIKSPQKMGKSSLLLRILHNAKRLRFITVLIDFQQADEEIFFNLEQFLRWFCSNVSYQLNLKPELNQYWDEYAGIKLNCTRYFQRHLLHQCQNPLVLVLNELHLLSKHPKILGEFLPLLRSWQEEIHYDQTLQNLHLILVYTTGTTSSLLNLNQPLFDVGLPIQLPNLSLAQVQELVQRYNLNYTICQSEAQQIASLLLNLVDGHPYLIQMALYHLWQNNVASEQFQQIALSPYGIYESHLQQHLAILEKNPVLISTFKQIVQANDVVPVTSFIAHELENLGLVKLEPNGAKVCCQLYQRYFSKLFSQQEFGLQERQLKLLLHMA